MNVGENMITFVTGLSGSGKSFIVDKICNGDKKKSEHIDLDQYTCYLINPQKYENIVSDKNIIFYIDNVLKKQEKYEVTWDCDPNLYHDKFIEWLKKQDKDYVVEGIQIYNGLISKEQLVNEKIIIVDASLMKCSLYRIKRAWIKGKSFKEKLQLIKHNGIVREYHIKNYQKLEEFKKSEGLNFEIYRN